MLNVIHFFYQKSVVNSYQKLEGFVLLIFSFVTEADDCYSINKYSLFHLKSFKASTMRFVASWAVQMKDCQVGNFLLTQLSRAPQL